MLCQACNIKCKIEMSQQQMSVAVDLVRYAKENEIDEIVIGLRRPVLSWENCFSDPPPAQVILDAPCPVLAVK